jgi:hypothetical protein
MDYPWPPDDPLDEETDDAGEYYEIPLALLPPLAALLICLAGLFWALRLPFGDLPAPVEASLAAGLPARADADAAIAPFFAAEVRYWQPQILAWAQAWQLDPNLIATVMQIESCGDPQARSSAGAMGLFQVMPFHFAAGEDGYDVETNARRGLAYLSKTLTARRGDVRLALAAYNGGLSGTSRPEALWAQETQRYVYWGEGIYQDALAGEQSSARLEEWLTRGGGLCRQAARRLGLPVAE